MPVAPWILPVLWHEHDWRAALERLAIELASKEDGPALERAAVDLGQAYEYVEPDRRRAIDVYGLAGAADDGRACQLAAELAWWAGRARLLVARRAHDRDPVLVLAEAEAWWDADQHDLSALALAGVRNVDSPRIEDLAELLGGGDRAAQADAAVARAKEQAPAEAAESLLMAARFAKAAGATTDAAHHLEAALAAAPGHPVAAGHLLALALASGQPERMRGYLRARHERLPPLPWIDGMRASAFAMIETRQHRGFGLRLLRRALERVYDSKLPDDIPGHLAMWTVLAAHAHADGTRRELMPLVLTALQSTQRPIDRVWLGALATEISLRDAGSAIVAGAYAEIVAEHAPQHPVISELVVAVAESGVDDGAVPAVVAQAGSGPGSDATPGVEVTWTPSGAVRTMLRAATASEAHRIGADGDGTTNQTTNRTPDRPPDDVRPVADPSRPAEADDTRTAADHLRTAADASRAAESRIPDAARTSDMIRTAADASRAAASSPSPSPSGEHVRSPDTSDGVVVGVVVGRGRASDSSWDLDESALHRAVPVAPPPELVSTTITTRYHQPPDLGPWQEPAKPDPALVIPPAAVMAANASLEHAIPVDVEVELAGVYADAALAATAAPEVFEGEIELLDEDSAPVHVTPSALVAAASTSIPAPRAPVAAPARPNTGPTRVTVSIPKVLPPPRAEEPKPQKPISMPAIAIPAIGGGSKKTMAMPSIAKKPAPASSAVPTPPPLPPLGRATPPPAPGGQPMRKPTDPHVVLDALRTPDRPPIAPRPPEPPNAVPRSRRISIPIDVKLVLSDGTRVAGHSRDISASGLFVLTNAELPEGGEVNVELLLPGKEAFTEEEHHVRARIARRDGDGVGIELVDPDARLTAALDDL